MSVQEIVSAFKAQKRVILDAPMNSGEIELATSVARDMRCKGMIKAIYRLSIHPIPDSHDIIHQIPAMTQVGYSDNALVIVDAQHMGKITGNPYVLSVRHHNIVSTQVGANYTGISSLNIAHIDGTNKYKALYDAIAMHKDTNTYCLIVHGNDRQYIDVILGTHDSPRVIDYAPNALDEVPTAFTIVMARSMNVDTLNTQHVSMVWCDTHAPTTIPYACCGYDKRRDLNIYLS